MKKKFAILQNRFNDNFALIPFNTGMGQTMHLYWNDEKRWLSWGELETDNPLIIDSPAIKERGVLEISSELLRNLASDVKRVYAGKRDTMPLTIMTRLQEYHDTIAGLGFERKKK